MTFPMRGNVCFECEVEFNTDIITSEDRKSVMTRTNRDWIKTARRSGYYPLTFNFVLGKVDTFVLCSYCGISIPEKNITRDHVYPKSKGGILKTPSCGPCNQAKEDMLPIEWALYAMEYGLDIYNIKPKKDSLAA